VPLARGGTNWIENILPACRVCNARKHLLTEDEFRARLAAERDAD
jgi:5-methylcytosine-specific restriction endonuclease McrA